MFDEDFELGQIREKYRVPLEKGEAVAERVRADVEPLSEALVLVGSIRRRRPYVADVEYVVLPKDLGEFDAAVRAMGFEAGGKRRKYTAVVDGVKVELYVAHKRDEMGAMVLMYTGDYLMNIAMRSKAKRLGYKLDQYGVWKEKRAVLQDPDEREFFDFLGMEFHWPEQRSLAARSELHKMGRKLLERGLPEDEAAFVEGALTSLRTEKTLAPDAETRLRALYAGRFGTAVEKASRAALGAEELIELGAAELVELGIMAPDGLFDGPEELLEDPGQVWQRFYMQMTGRSGELTGLIVRPLGGNLFQIWARAIEEGRPVYYLVYHGEFTEETMGAPPEEVLNGFVTWAIDGGEAPPWLGPREDLPEAT